MICQKCCDGKPDLCRGGTWCDNQHKPLTGTKPEWRDLAAEFNLPPHPEEMYAEFKPRILLGISTDDWKGLM